MPGSTLAQCVQKPVPLSTLQSMSSTLTPDDVESRIQGQQKAVNPVAETCLAVSPAAGLPLENVTVKRQVAEGHVADVAASTAGARLRLVVNCCTASLVNVGVFIVWCPVTSLGVSAHCT